MAKHPLFLGSDHAGVRLKALVIEKLRVEFSEFEIQDFGTHEEASTDYPLYAQKVAHAVAAERGAKGILICGSGIGMSVAANKVTGIRAALVWDATSARLCRQHNDANILCLGARLIGPEVALDCVRAFLTADFDTQGRHSKRLELIQQMEKK
jgi:ribose 5-phosphate isomerase B